MHQHKAFPEYSSIKSLECNPINSSSNTNPYPQEPPAVGTLTLRLAIVGVVVIGSIFES